MGQKSHIRGGKMRSKDNSKFSSILKFIEEYKNQHNAAPSTKEIAEGTGISKSTVNRYLMDMRDRNIIRYSGHRNIVNVKDSAGVVKVPVLGTVSCGLPKFAEENIEEYVSLPVSLFGKGDFYILRANGDSMIDAGIDDGDLVLIRNQNTANTGQIVVALIEDEATLKRFYPENNQVRLHPENSSLNDIYVDNCIIQGVAVKVLKDLEN